MGRQPGRHQGRQHRARAGNGFDFDVMIMRRAYELIPRIGNPGRPRIADERHIVALLEAGDELRHARALVMLVEAQARC